MSDLNEKNSCHNLNVINVIAQMSLTKLAKKCITQY